MKNVMKLSLILILLSLSLGALAKSSFSVSSKGKRYNIKYKTNDVSFTKKHNSYQFQIGNFNETNYRNTARNPASNYPVKQETKVKVKKNPSLNLNSNSLYLRNAESVQFTF
ncbi:MAG: hypothetical protein ACI9QD_000721 [Thermoproteota archaeon]|jgi:hypothetical protein